MRLTPKPTRAAQTKDRRPKSRGQGLVEFALILPVFLVLLSAAIDFGRLAYARIAVENAAREGAFQASITPTSYTADAACPPVNPATGEPDSNLVICRALLEAEGSVIGLMPSDIHLSCSPDCTEGLGHTVTVTVDGTFNLLTPFMAVFFGGYVIDFSSSATMQIETYPAPPPAGPPSPSPSVDPSASPSVEPSPSPSSGGGCVTPSAGFTYTTVDGRGSPTGNKTPVDVTVTDTSTAAGSCPITSWTWHWGDGSVDYVLGPDPPTHRYYNNGPAVEKSYNLSLTVTNCASVACSATSGTVLITVHR